MDGNGLLDLVSDDQPSGHLVIFFQVSPRVFAQGDQLLSSGATPVGVAASDLNEDGLLDLAAANYGSGSVTIFLQSRPGQFSTPQVLRAGAIGSPQPVWISAHDLDGDGDRDLIYTDWTGFVRIFFQWGPGQFSREPDLDVGSFTATGCCLGPAVLPADLDGDGDVEIIFTDFNEGKIKILSRE